MVFVPWPALPPDRNRRVTWRRPQRDGDDETLGRSNRRERGGDFDMLRRLLPIIGALAVVATALATPASAGVAARAACGPSWRVVPSPSPGSVNNSLADVVLTSAGNGWAVGTELTESGPALLTLP